MEKIEDIIKGLRAVKEAIRTTKPEGKIEGAAKVRHIERIDAAIDYLKERSDAIDAK